MVRSFLASLFLAGAVFGQPVPTPSPTSGPFPTSASSISPSFTPNAAPGTSPSNDLIGPINMPGDSLDAVLSLLERWTGKTLLRPQNLPAATITLNLRERVSKQEAVQAVETLLNLNGIALTPMGDRFLKVTALNAVKSEAPEFIEESTLSLPPSGRTASKLFTLQFLRVGEFMPQISGLLNPAAGSPPVVFDKANAALITDSVSNLQRIETLVARLDQPSLAGLAPKFYQLQSGAKASDVVNKIRTMLTGALQTQLGTTTSINPDDRTNQIVLIADARQHPFFDDLIARLDVKSDPNTRNEVIGLKHAAAKDVATVLSQLVTGQNAAARASQSDPARATSNTVAGAPVNAPASPANTITAAPPVAATVASLGEVGADLSNQFSTLLTILPEERTNSIVVSGTLDDIRLINDLVAKIDTLLAQVRIEVVIAEITLTDTASSGISALGLTVTADKLSGFSASSPDFAGVSELTGVITTPGVVGAGPYDLAGTLKLNTTPRKSNATILSQPNIITTHNREGKIFVGEERPVISSYLNDNTGTGNGNGTGVGTGYRSTINSKEIGITLTVKPLIGSDGSVQLEIEQEVSDVIGTVNVDQNEQPIVGRRTTKSFVTARSGEIIVLGGLQRTSKNKSSSRLGPIPIIGDLLGARKRTDTRTDLIFFLRPTVLTNTAEDNLPAMSQIEKFPEIPRNKVKEALGTAAPRS